MGNRGRAAEGTRRCQRGETIKKAGQTGTVASQQQPTGTRNLIQTQVCTMNNTSNPTTPTVGTQSCVAKRGRSIDCGQRMARTSSHQSCRQLQWWKRTWSPWEQRCQWSASPMDPAASFCEGWPVRARGDCSSMGAKDMDTHQSDSCSSGTIAERRRERTVDPTRIRGRAIA